MKIGRFIAGIVSGVTFGVLFAPKKGKQLRKEVSKGKGDFLALGKAFKEAGEDALEEIKKLSKHEQVEAFLQMSEDKIKEISSNLEDGSSQTVKNAKARLEEISAFALQKVNDLKDLIKKKEEDEEEENGEPAPKKLSKKIAAKKKAAKKTITSKLKKIVKKSPLTK